jgi:hypothetical protein
MAVSADTDFWVFLRQLVDMGVVEIRTERLDASIER